jgi:hypothetical protein
MTTPLTAEQRKRVGPKLNVLRDCYGCAHHSSESYRVQGDSGYEHYCDHSERRHIGGSSRTPDWCPAERQAQPHAADRAEALSERCAALECAMKLEVGEKRFAHLKAVLDSLRPGADVAQAIGQSRAEEFEARVKVLEGLLREALPVLVSQRESLDLEYRIRVQPPTELETRIARELAQPEGGHR